ncbi:Fis family transcriptional regulator [Xanthomonas bromi]|nr:XRE family transcriptional regulator [Xanthomonas bromi]SBV53291.1 Fis family transcriptional regulator [Xanthomonas bromi]
MGRKETEEAIADSRAGHVSERFSTVAELLTNLSADDTPNVLQGSANAYAAPNYPDADEMLLKARLVTKIGEAIKARHLSAEQAATLFGLTLAALHELLNGRFRVQSVNDLERLASLIDETSR